MIMPGINPGRIQDNGASFGRISVDYGHMTNNF